ncbi:MAG: hypothetical protein EAX96_08385 [Candidatus Lokiarchaeota archaeon]|nr:hypothetical protein [Candidatus Lokiarchaeota archaeon]
MDSEDIFVLKGEVKKKMKQLEDLTIEYQKFKINFGKKMAQLMQEKMAVQVQFDQAKAEADSYKSRIDTDFVPSGEIEDLKSQIAKTGETLRERSEQIKKLNEIVVQKDRTLKTVQDQMEKTLKLKEDTIKDKEDQAKDALSRARVAESQMEILKGRMRELEERLMKTTTEDEKGKTIINLIKQIEENEKITFDLKKEHAEMKEKLREVLAARSDINKIINEADEKERKIRKELLDEKEKIREELESLIDRQKIRIDRLEEELKLFKQDQPEGVIFGEKQAMEIIKEILKNTKRNAVLFLPKLDLIKKYDLNLKEIPDKLNIRIGTNVDDITDPFLDELRDYPHILVKEYKNEDLLAILSDNADLFVSFLKKDVPPSGIRTTNEVAIEFMGTLLLQNFSRSKSFF